MICNHGGVAQKKSQEPLIYNGSAKDISESMSVFQPKTSTTVL